MKKEKRKVKGLAIATIVLCILLVTVTIALIVSNTNGIATNKSAAYSDGAYIETFAAYDNSYEMDVAEESFFEGNSIAQNVKKEQSKIIYTASLTIDTKNFDNTLRGIDAFVTKNDGYVENSYVTNGSGQYRSATYTVRVPAENLNKLLDAFENVGTIKSISRSADDISEYYYDTEARLNTAKIKLARLQELLKDAEDMSDIITIEEAISNVEYDIDNYSGSLKYYDSQVEYSTVTINVNEVYEEMTETVPMTFGEKVSKAVQDGITGFKNVIKGLIIFIAEAWIWLLMIVVIVIIITCIVKTKKRKRQRLEYLANKKQKLIEKEKDELED